MTDLRQTSDELLRQSKKNLIAWFIFIFVISTAGLFLI